MGERPEGTTLDRIDVNGPYSPENCRWATHEVQVSNKRTNRMITAFGHTKPMKTMCRMFHMDARTILSRINGGMTPEEALTAKSGNRWHPAVVDQSACARLRAEQKGSKP